MSGAKGLGLRAWAVGLAAEMVIGSGCHAYADSSAHSAGVRGDVRLVARSKHWDLLWLKYEWINATSFLAFWAEKLPVIDSSERLLHTPQRWDMVTHRAYPLSRLRDALAETPALVAVAITHRGDRVLWSSYVVGFPSLNTAMSATIDGTHVAGPTDIRARICGWMPDGRHWYVLEQAGRHASAIALYDAITGTRTMHAALLPSVSLRPDVAIESLPDGGWVAIGGSAWTWRQKCRVVTVSLLRLRRSVERYRTHQIQCPRGFGVVDVRSSPDGTRLAWLFESADSTVRKICVSRLDGSHMREIVYQSGIAADPRGLRFISAPFAISTIRWVPTGRKVSFALRNGIYVVRAR